MIYGVYMVMNRCCASCFVLLCAMLAYNESSALSLFKKKKKSEINARKELVKDLSTSPLFLKRQALEKLGFDISSSSTGQINDVVDLELLNTNNIVTLCKLFFEKVGDSFPPVTSKSRAEMDELLKRILDDKDNMNDLLSMHYPELVKIFDEIINDIDDEHLELKTMVRTLKTTLCTVANIIDVDRYYDENKEEIQKYKTDCVEFFVNSEANIQSDLTGLVKVGGGLNFSVQSGNNGGDFIKSKTLSVSLKDSLALKDIINTSLSNESAASSGARYVSIKQIALANNNKITNKISEKNLADYTDAYALFCEKLNLLTEDVKEIRQNLRRLELMLRMFGIIKGYDTLSLNFKDGRYTTEFIKTLSNKTSVRVESGLLSSLSLSASVEKKRSTYRKESDAVINLKKERIIIHDKEYISSILNIFGGSRRIIALFNGDASYFKSMIEKTGISDAKKLNDFATTYLNVLNLGKTSRSMKKELEKQLGTLGRKETIKCLTKMFAYFCWTEKQENIADLNATKTTICALIERLHDDSYYSDKKYSLKKLKAKVAEQTYIISFLDDLLTFSYKSVANDPNIENNGAQLRLKINLSTLKKLNNMQESSKKIINNIIQKLGIDVQEFSTDRHISDKFFKICSALHDKIEEAILSRKNKESDKTLMNALSAFRDVLLSVATDFANMQYTPWKRNIPFSSNSSAVTLEFVKNALEEKNLTFSRAFLAASKKTKLEIGINHITNHHESSLSTTIGVNASKQFGNSYENDSTIYNVMRSFLKYAREYEADKGEIPMSVVYDYVEKYPFLLNLISSAKDGRLYNSVQKYKGTYLQNNWNESTADDEIINELVTVLYQYYSKKAKTHYSRTYNKHGLHVKKKNMMYKLHNLRSKKSAQ